MVVSTASHLLRAMFTPLPWNYMLLACLWFAVRIGFTVTNIQRPLPMTFLATLLPVLSCKTVDTVLASLWLLFSVHVDITSSIATWNRLAGLVVDAMGWLAATAKVL